MSLYKLQPGIEPEWRIDLLLRLTKITSPDVIKGVKRVLIHGESEDMAAYMLDIDKKAIYRALDRLNEVNEIVEKVKEGDIHGKAT